MNNTHRKMRSRIIALLPTVAVLLAGPWTAGAVTNTYTEDFTTKAYCDTGLTTIWWDTNAGQLHYYPFQPGLAGSVDPGGFSWRLDVDGNYAFIADGIGSGLRVVSITNPDNPVLAGQYLTTATAYGVDVQGNYAYVAADNELLALDISAPWSPTLAASASYSNGLTDVMASGKYIFTTSNAGVLVFEHVQYAAMGLTGMAFSFSGIAQGIYVRGDKLYVAAGSSGLHVIDAFDPSSSNMLKLGTYNSPGTAADVVVDGDYAYLADGLQGLAVVDVSNPSAPVLAGQYFSGGTTIGVAVSGDYAFLADYTGGFKIVDISDPTNPTLAWDVDLGVGVRPRDVFVAGEHAFVAAGDNGFFSAHVAQPIAPVFKSSDPAPGAPLKMTIDGNHLFYIVGGSFQIREIQDPDNSTALGGVVVGTSYDFEIRENRAYVSSTNNGVIFLDLSDLFAPAAIGTLVTTSSSPRGIVLDGYEGYVALGSSGIDQFSVHSAGGVLNLPTPSAVERLAVAGNYLYAVGTGFHVFDTSGPGVPVLIGSYPGGGSYSRFAIHGNAAYVTGSGLDIFSLYAAIPNFALHYTDIASGVAVAGDYAFLGVGGPIETLNLTSPYLPVSLGQSVASGNTPTSVWGEFVVTQNGLFRAFDRLYDSGKDTAVSTKINGLSFTVLAAKATATYEGNILWEMSADGGLHWRSLPPLNIYDGFFFPGADLRWRATFDRPALNASISATSISFEWLYEVPVITSISDISNDQGRKVRLSWKRSGYDGYLSEILQYAVYRRWDPGAGVASTAKRPDPGPLATLPPGEWDFVTTIPATAEENYSVVVPTLADSTISNGMYQSVFFVSAMGAQPNIHYDSPPDSGYSLDNLAPTAPQNVVLAENTGAGNALSWDECPDNDFQYFRIYRGDDPGFPADPAHLVAATTSTGWNDPDFDGWSKSYKTTSVDYSGNESDPSSPLTSTGIEREIAPVENALYQNVPNPFNPATTIRYALRAPEDVLLTVFDAAGRRVRTLVDAHVEPGVHTVTWDGRGPRGSQVASGVYFYRLEAGSFVQTRKMVLLK